MEEAYLIDAAQGQVDAGQPRLTLVGEVLQGLLKRTGVPARRLQEIHWLESSANLLEPGLMTRVKELGFTSDLTVFQWPAVPVLAHFVLQSVVRAVENGERDLVMICQFGQLGRLHQDSLVALLVASPAAVGRHNLAPRARFGKHISVNLRGDGKLNQLAAMRKVDAEEDELPPEEKQPEPKEIGVSWLAAARKVDGIAQDGVFPGAQWLDLPDTVSTGDLFLLGRLLETLEEQRGDGGVLLGEGPQGLGLATLIQRM